MGPVGSTSLRRERAAADGDRLGRRPSSSPAQRLEFDDAPRTGDKAHVHFVSPRRLRAGVEVRPIDDLRVEAAWVHEFWSAHETI